MLLLDVKPAGQRRSKALVSRESGCSFEWVDHDVYPDSSVAHGERLRQLRLDSCLSAREVAARAGLRTSDVCALELGSKMFATDADRKVYVDAVEARSLSGPYGAEP